MSSTQTQRVGTIVWRDLTVANADQVRDFYAAVVGWTAQPIDMGGYSDYSMLTPGGEGVAGICHARGANANIPPQWLMYIEVADIEASIQKVVELGGVVLDGPREAGPARFCIIRDPAGAVVGLITSPQEDAQ